MENLLEIINVLTKNKVSKIEVLDEQILRNKDSKFGLLYEALVTGKISKDEDAANILYHNKDVGDARYRQLKSRFKRRLYNTLFFLDMNVPLTANRAQAQYNCNKEWALVEIMLIYNAPNSALVLARQILIVALKFHFTDLIVKCSRLLREQAVQEENRKAFEEYNAYVETHTPILEAETRAEELAQKARLEYQVRHFDEQKLQRIEELGKELIQIVEKTDSPLVQYHVFTAWVLLYEAQHEYSHVLEIAEKAEEYVRSMPDYFNDQKKIFFLIKRFSIYLHLRQYREGKAYAEVVLTDLSANSQEWLDFMEYYLLLSLHTDNWINALAIFNKVADSVAFKKIDDLRQEKWEIFEAFLHYFIETESINPNLMLRQKRKTFKINDFIQKSSNYSSKYVTIALHHLVLKIAFLLYRRNFAALPKLMEQLRKLSQYELKKEGYERAAALIQLLYHLEKAEFQIDKLRNIEKLIEKFEEYPFYYRGKVAELEVIPYDKLWQRLGRHLE
ncbi:MAG: hypothetical protein SFU99_10715 [Saprospiraceae bacterium]|nr:hypothetical protein [Saprospiraceae bacterium]